MSRFVLVTLVSALTACTVDAGTFESAFGSSASGTDGGDGFGSSGGEGTGSDGGSGGSSDGGGSSSGDTDGVGDPTDGSSSGDGATSGADDGGGTFGSTGGGDTGGGDTGGGSTTTAGGSTGGLTEDGPYTPCQTTADCGDASLACLKSDQNGADGFCSALCGSGSPPNPGLCPDAPDGVTAEVICVEGFFANSCALDCSGGKTCPAGTECLPANNGHGPFCYGV